MSIEGELTLNNCLDRRLQRRDSPSASIQTPRMAEEGFQHPVKRPRTTKSQEEDNEDGTVALEALLGLRTGTAMIVSGSPTDDATTPHRNQSNGHETEGINPDSNPNQPLLRSVPVEHLTSSVESLLLAMMAPQHHVAPQRSAPMIEGQRQPETPVSPTQAEVEHTQSPNTDIPPVRNVLASSIANTNFSDLPEPFFLLSSGYLDLNQRVSSIETTSVTQDRQLAGLMHANASLRRTILAMVGEWRGLVGAMQSALQEQIAEVSKLKAHVRMLEGRVTMAETRVQKNDVNVRGLGKETGALSETVLQVMRVLEGQEHARRHMEAKLLKA